MYWEVVFSKIKKVENIKKENPHIESLFTHNRPDVDMYRWVCYPWGISVRWVAASVYPLAALANIREAYSSHMRVGGVGDGMGVGVVAGVGVGVMLSNS